MDYAAYDATFAQACVGESEETLCRMALDRLLLPFGLSRQCPGRLRRYFGHPGGRVHLRHPATGRGRPAAADRFGPARAEAAAQCARAGWSAGAAILLSRSKRAPKQYDFDDL